MLKVVLSFDDGRRDNYRAAFEILKPLELPATFNITIGYILRNISDQEKPGPHEPMTIEELKSLVDCDLFEIAGHGYCHDNDINNLLEGVLQLRKLFPGAEIKGIASPHSEFNLDELETAENLFSKNEIHYLRISNDYSKMGKLKIWVRRLNRFLHFPCLYAWTNIDSVIREKGFLLHSFPVIRDNSLKEVIGLIEKLSYESRNLDQTCILMFHSILKQGEDFYNDLFTWDYNIFKEFCSYLSKKSKENSVIINKTIDL